VLIPFSTPPAQPICWRFTPAVAVPCFSWPVSSRAPIASARLPRRRAAAWSRPATANRRTALIAAASSQAARFKSRCVGSGDRSPACRAIVHPLRRGRSLVTAATYFPACSHVPVHLKTGLISSISSARFRAASLTATLAAAAASDCRFVTQT